MSTIPISVQAQLTNALATIHVVGKQRTFTITNIHITNVGVVDTTVELCAYPLTVPATTPSAVNALLWDFIVPANDFIELGEGLMFLSEYTIAAQAGVGNAINVNICGTES